ncbi:Speckle-type POZ protein B [Araneus ventricosus]|uniref:Speckle-type POZ protein B n=1 Tax=Araneus ventricosus TaxID=182803 RepID=A0A4Y2WAB9_ARAVE|nr:Speckle-type POZ protein B [Araneus ventricosus]
MKSLYLNQFLTDVELKTKSFPANKIVLCGRSPVFKAMLTNDMKETNTDCIQVDDLGDDVVEQLLFFLYSDTVETLQWEIASQLYYAADKYEVCKLKEVCSSFLVENLTPTNAGELLLLADTHSDGELKKSVEDFILEHEEQVFGSDEWEMLMETNPLLFMKAMHLKYKRRKGSK